MEGAKKPNQTNLFVLPANSLLSFSAPACLEEFWLHDFPIPHFYWQITYSPENRCCKVLLSPEVWAVRQESLHTVRATSTVLCESNKSMWRWRKLHYIYAIQLKTTAANLEKNSLSLALLLEKSLQGPKDSDSYRALRARIGPLSMLIPMLILSIFFSSHLLFKIDARRCILAAKLLISVLTS